MPSREPTQRLEDILENINLIESFVVGLDAESFRDSPRSVYAVKRALLIVSEAAKRLGEGAERLCPGPPWAQVRGPGNLLRHRYDRVDTHRIWLVIEQDLQPLKLAAERALDALRA